MKSYDAIIIGAGPAGATCARQLARKGASVLLLDREAFPRTKPCGGGFSEKARDLFDFDLSPVLEATIFQAEIALRSERAAVVARPDGAGYMVCREKFDTLLVEKAVAAGAVLNEKEPFDSLQADTDGWVVRTERDTYRAGFLVGADGVHSRVARCLGLMNTFDRYAPAVTAEIEVPDAVLEKRRHSVTFDFHVFGKGYAWIFPKADHLSVGLFSTQFPLKGMGRALTAYIDRHPDLRSGHVRYCKGGLIPRGGTRQVLSTGRALLAGDAAAMTDPFFGEGIYYAARSGMLAADAILSALQSGGSSLSNYDADCDREITRDLWWARGFNFTFYRMPFIFYPAIRRSSHLQELVVDINNGRFTWKGGVGRIIASLPWWVTQALLP